MVGVVLIAIVLVLALPVAVMVGGALWSALFATAVGDDARQRAEGRPT